MSFRKCFFWTKCKLLAIVFFVCNIANAQTCQAEFQYFGINNNHVYLYDMSTATSGIVSWQYDFGDGTTSTEQSPFHQFPGLGNYEVCLTIGTSDGCTNTFCDTIVVECISSADFDVDFTNCPTVEFIDQSSTTPDSLISWLYEVNGDSLHMPNSSYTFASNGWYVVSLWVETSSGCFTHHSDTIEINCLPVHLDEMEDFSVSLYPNPCSDIINIETLNPFNSPYEICNLQSKLVQKGVLPFAANQAIPIDGISSGWYLLSFRIDDIVIRKHFLKE